MSDISSNKLFFQALTFIILGVIIILCMLRVAQMNIIKKNSPKTIGKITEVNSKIGPTPDRGSSVRSSGYTWQFSLKYTYTVNGREFTGSSLYSGNDNAIEGVNSGDLDEPKPDRIVMLENKYHVGQSVDVYFNIRKPSKSFLIYRSRPWGFVIVFLFALSFLSAGIYMLINQPK